MTSHARDAAAWRAVIDDLRRVLESLRTAADRPLRAPLHLRIGVARLQAALLDDAEGLARRVLGEAFTPTPEVVARLGDCLAMQLGGRQPPRPVLEALPPGVRAAATADVTAALQCDPAYGPALQAAAALAVVSGRWTEAATWYERLAQRRGPPDATAAALVALGDIRWRKLGQPQPAREHYAEARSLVGDDPVLLDKLLKVDLELERWPAAIETCRTLLEQLRRRPGRADVAVTYLLTLGEIHLYGLGEPEAALRHYLDAVACAPGYDLTYTLLRELLETAERSNLEVLLSAVADRTPLADRLRAALSARGDDVASAVRAFRDAVDAATPAPDAEAS